MQRSLNIGEQLRRDLKTKGVRVDNLVIDITDRIVVISGHEPQATEDAIARQLVDAWLPKPLNVERLLQTMRSLRIVKQME